MPCTSSRQSICASICRTVYRAAAFEGLKQRNRDRVVAAEDDRHRAAVEERAHGAGDAPAIALGIVFGIGQIPAIDDAHAVRDHLSTEIEIHVMERAAPIGDASPDRRGGAGAIGADAGIGRRRRRSDDRSGRGGAFGDRRFRQTEESPGSGRTEDVAYRRRCAHRAVGHCSVPRRLNAPKGRREARGGVSAPTASTFLRFGCSVMNHIRFFQLNNFPERFLGSHLGNVSR